MWSFFKKNKKTEVNPDSVIENLIIDIENAIIQCKKTLPEAIVNKENIGLELQKYQQQAEYLHKNALEATKKGNELKAKDLLNQKIPVDIALQNYQNLYQNATENVKKLEIQLVKMNTQLLEIKTKKSILVAQLSQAQTQKEITQKLNELNFSTEKYEHEIINTKLDNQTQLSYIDQELQNLEDFDEKLSQTIDLQALKNEIKTEEIQNQQKKDEFLEKKFTQFFKENLTQKNTQEPTNNSKIINDFFENQTSKNEEKKTQIDDFFNTKNEDKNKKIDDFFGK